MNILRDEVNVVFTVDTPIKHTHTHTQYTCDCEWITNPLETGDFDDKFKHSYVNESLTNKETFFQYFLVILKRSLENLEKNVIGPT